LVAFQVR